MHALAHLSEPNCRACQEAVHEAVLEVDVAVDCHVDFVLLVGEEWGRFEVGRVAHVGGRGGIGWERTELTNSESSVSAGYDGLLANR